MSRKRKRLLGVLLVLTAVFLGYLAAAPGRSLPMAPPEDVMIETLEWVVPEGELPLALLIEDAGGLSGTVGTAILL